MGENQPPNEGVINNGANASFSGIGRDATGGDTYNFGHSAPETVHKLPRAFSSLRSALDAHGGDGVQQLKDDVDALEDEIAGEKGPGRIRALAGRLAVAIALGAAVGTAATHLKNLINDVWGS